MKTASDQLARASGTGSSSGLTFYKQAIEEGAKYVAAALEKELEKHPEDLRGTLRDAYNTPADKRTDEQKKLLADRPSVNINPGVLYQYNPKAADDLKAGVRVAAVLWDSYARDKVVEMDADYRFDDEAGRARALRLPRLGLRSSTPSATWAASSVPSSTGSTTSST